MEATLLAEGGRTGLFEPPAPFSGALGGLVSAELSHISPSGGTPSGSWGRLRTPPRSGGAPTTRRKANAAPGGRRGSGGGG
ncbi:hypothetical protein GCM10009544_58280 [Streptomyces stramineus]|uniref:Uncharacterized protein n=1 Tax=Streptomyces stramineus TaxID=173861 RepID=A0ABN1B3U9_9ACTN